MGEYILQNGRAPCLFAIIILHGSNSDISFPLLIREVTALFEELFDGLHRATKAHDHKWLVAFRRSAEVLYSRLADYLNVVIWRDTVVYVT